MSQNTPVHSRTVSIAKGAWYGFKLGVFSAALGAGIGLAVGGLVSILSKEG